MPRSLRAMMAALCCALAAPAAAGAATLTVDPADNGSCDRTADTVCKTISAAVAAAQSKDTIQVKEGTYAEAVSIPSDKSELLISGAGDVAKTKVTGPSDGGDTLTISAEKTVVSGLTVLSTAAGSSAVVIGAAGALLKGVILQRADATEAADPVVAITSGPSTIEQAFIVQNAGPAASPAIVSSGAGLKLLDSLVVSAKGDALVLTAGEDNLIQRSQLLAPVGGATALSITSAANSSADKKVTLDSTVLSGGAATGTGLLARSAGSGTPVPSSTAGDITVVARHITVAGAKNGVVLDASEANGSPLAGSGAGNITGTFTASILHGASRADKFEGSQLSGASNVATLDCTACNGPKATGDGTITGLDGSANTDAAKLFRKNSFLLRADAADVIDRGGAITSGESAKDVDQDDRTVGSATDIGADEFRNRAPVAVFGITNAKPKEGEPTGFISGSSDPEAESGGGIAKYRWDFGDGQTQETTVAGVAHTYAKRGTYQARLTAIDNFGAETTAAAQTVTVVDGTAPSVSIIAPADAASLTVTRRVTRAKCRTRRTTARERRKNPRRLTRRVCTKRKVRKARALGINGSVSDDAAIESVEYSLRLVQRSGERKPSATCEFYASGKSFETRECGQPLWRPAIVQGSLWGAAIAPGLLPPGRYELRVRATDSSGNVAAKFTRGDKTESVFRLK